MIAHPDHAVEQAYIERVHRAEERARERRQQAPEAAADKASARELRKQMMERLSEPIDPDALCFGRIDRESGGSLYLGRGAVRDENNDLLVINWRMPVAAPFYTATPNDPQGIRLRRRFQLDHLRLLGIVDEAFKEAPAGDHPRPTAERHAEAPEGVEPTAGSEAGVPEQPVQPDVVDAILSEMDRARGTSMRDIVATIEARQYELITDNLEGLLVIQGGPGTGKTAIALHRAAWLLYNHRDQLERAGVLVVGPNRAFMEYVAEVLPALGESAVGQTTVDRLPALGDVRVRAQDSADVARLKGDLRMADVVGHAVRARARPPDEELQVRVERARVAIRPEEVAALVERAWQEAETYLAARDAFRRSLVNAVAERMPEPRGIFRSGPTSAEIEAAVTASGGPADRIWPTVTAPEVVRDLLGSHARLSSSAPFLSDAERTALYRERAQSLRDESWTSADMPLLDEADVAIRGRQRGYGYVLVDEAQDLTPMQLRMALRRSAAGRATLVGDIAQSTGAWRFSDWQELVAASGAEISPRIAELAIGYRVPRQIVDLAAELVPRIASELLVPTAVREGAEEPRLLRVGEEQLLQACVNEARGRLDGDRSVGLIAAPSRIPVVGAALSEAGVQVGDVLADGLARRLTLLSPAQAKGLEFDHVVVLDPAGMAGEEEDWAHVYVALTRATQTLSVVYATEHPFERAPTAPVSSPDSEAEAGATEAESPPPMPPAAVLGPRYTEALMQAKFLHLSQVRRGTGVPYLAHLQSVASLVLEDGGVRTRPSPLSSTIPSRTTGPKCSSGSPLSLAPM